MGDIAELQPSDQLQSLLNEQGLEVATSIIRPTDLDMDLEVTRLYGVETALPGGGTGRLIVRKVAQSADQYLRGLEPDDERRHSWTESQASGILADVQVSQVSRRGLFVARRSALSMQSPNGKSSITAWTFDRLGIGRTGDLGGVLDFDVSDMVVTRNLDPSEMEYAEPGKLRMLTSALKQVRRN